MFSSTLIYKCFYRTITYDIQCLHVINSLKRLKGHVDCTKVGNLKAFWENWTL